jgi:hypothetical protein
MEKQFVPFGELFLDTDTDPKINKGSDFILNTIVTSDGRHKISINCKGNSFVHLPANHNPTNPLNLLGWCVDEARNRIIMFCNSIDNDSIIYYNPFNGNNSTIMAGHSILNFNINYPINNPFIVGDILCWTDNYNEPKQINYIRALNYMLNISPSYSYVNKNMFDAYKRPGTPFSVTPVNSITGVETLRGKSYQWSYRFIYTDGQKSVLADSTTIYFTDIYNLPNGESVYDNNGFIIGIYQYILTVYIDYVNNDIQYIEIYVRNNETTDWYLYDTIQNPTSGFFQYTFDDKRLRVQADQEDLNRLYDYLPTLAAHQELIEKNRIIYANITEGFDPVSVNVTCNLVIGNANLGESGPIGNCTFGSNLGITWNIYSIGFLYGVMIIELNSTTGIYQVYNGRHVSIIGDADTDILDGLANTLIADGLLGVSVALVSSVLTLVIPITYGIKTRYLVRFFAYSYNTVYKSIKFGDSYLGAIRYYDKNLKFSSENRFAQTIDVPLYYSRPPLPIIDDNYGFGYFEVSVKNAPPIDACYYSIDFTKRIKIGYNVQLVCFCHDDYFFDAIDKKLRIRVNSLINDAKFSNPKLNISTYLFEKGDRLRMIGYKPYIFSYSLIATPDATLDVEIEGMEWPSGDTRYSKDQAATPDYITDANGNKVLSDMSSFIKVNITEANLATYTSGGGIFSNHTSTFGPYTVNYVGDPIVVEIYRPKKETDTPYYFPSIMLPIGNPGQSNRYHKGTSQHQNPSNPIAVPAIVRCNPGDTYTKLRDLKDIFICQEDNYSDYYNSNFHGFGRPNFYDANAKKATYKSSMRYSELLIENTRTNDLNKFLSNFTTLKSKFGGINFIHEVGDVLKVLQDKKETSIYVAKEEMTTASGDTILRANPNQVLGNINRMDEMRGTAFPRSVKIHNRDMYYWDGINGEVVRSSPNGQIPISEYGMKTYFKNKTGYTDVIGGWDEQNKIYFITFVGGSNPETLGFIEPKIDGQRPYWCSFFSFIPQLYINYGTFFGSWASRTIWVHNSDAVARCTFYGVKYNQQINFNFNINAAIKKIFRSLGIKSNKAWNVSEVSIESDSSYINGCLSEIPVGRFVLKEGEFWAPYMKNKLTHSSTPSILDLINGDEIRGDYAHHKLTNSENGEVWIMGIIINYDISNQY